MLTTAHYSPHTYDQNIVSLWRLCTPIKISQTCFPIQLYHKPHLLAQLYAITLPLYPTLEKKHAALPRCWVGFLHQGAQTTQPQCFCVTVHLSCLHPLIALVQCLPGLYKDKAKLECPQDSEASMDTGICSSISSSFFKRRLVYNIFHKRTHLTFCWGLSLNSELISRT